MDISSKTPARGYMPREGREGISEALNPFFGTDTFGDDERPRETPRKRSPIAGSSLPQEHASFS